MAFSLFGKNADYADARAARRCRSQARDLHRQSYGLAQGLSLRLSPFSVSLGLLLQI